jgi:SAM-dependent methyltransferase
MSQAVRKDVWSSGNAYEPYVGRWSRLVATEFLKWLAIPAGRDWLDVGCGTGALTETILNDAAPVRVLAVDASESFVTHARAHIVDVRASFRVCDAQVLPIEDEAFDATVSGLVLNFIPDATKALSEMRRVTRPGGMVAAYVWDYAGEMQMMRRFWDAAVELDPGTKHLDEGVRFPTCRPEPLRALFEQSGLTNVEVIAIDVPTEFRNFDDYWTPFLSGQAPAPGYCMSLSEDDRAALRECVRASLPIDGDGRIHLLARAWAVRGTTREP